MAADITPLIHRVRRWPRRVVITIAVVAVTLLAVRIALPYVVRNQVNHRLQSIPGYTGHVADIGIALWRGAYALEGVEIYKVSGEVRTPFVRARTIDFSVAWRDLFHGKIVSDILVEEGQLTFVAGATEAESQTDVDRRWQEVIEDLFPLEITHLEVNHGLLRYQDTTKTPAVDLFVTNLRLAATGLRNRPSESGEEFPAEIVLEGDSLGGGQLRLAISAEPLAAQPHFHLSAKLENVNLPELNESLKAYANVDVSRGKMELAAEMAGKDGGFQGYVKPFFEEVDFNNVSDENKSVLTRIWENVVQGLAWLVKNKARDQVGTRIPFQGRFGDPQVGLWTTIVNLFRHGFVRAFNPTIEGTVDPDNVLPTGDSADGEGVASEKPETPPKVATDDVKKVEPEAAAPTDQPSKKRTP
ncbi:DUF748 domain-containing protein [Opitutus terrae]|uniref:DUF748 domain-containing protein n=1 Tax=Opitutus terrae (strain DSM 11246 / JCM 15787 / PB90-1) TaxID=452637 RepID=B1ZPU2_OPITP|nr:DUF748 domain-containing protein [Opitutus terrae]ACB75545.1 conserved hypothetical protein [Opitutus terrae PB90-1]